MSQKASRQYRKAVLTAIRETGAGVRAIMRQRPWWFPGFAWRRLMRFLFPNLP